MSIKIDFNVQGNREVSDRFYTETITLKGKIERDIDDAINTDGDIAIPITKIGTLSKIFAYSTNAILKVTDGTGTYSLPINGPFYWSLTTAYAATVTALSVSTLATQAVDIKISVYGV